MKWKINGEVLLSCNCELFCPCVISLGKAKPSAGYCHSWWGVKILDGFCGDEKLDGLCVGILLDVPGRMGEGGWTVALYVDDSASAAAAAGLEKIFTGQAGGSLGILSLLVERVLGVRRAALSFDKNGGDGWRMTAVCDKNKIADCAIVKQKGKDDGGVIIRNSQYWVASDVVVAVGEKSKVRAFGRVWDFSGMSAEYAKVAWASDE